MKMRTHKNKVQIILNELYPNENVDVPDPYFGMTNGFEIVYTMLMSLRYHSRQINS
jgi:protein-tyrosine phosphatase